MSKKKKSEAMPDPTIPDVSVEIDGKSYRLCFDFAAMARAKAALKKTGVEINILRSLNFDAIDADTLPALFLAASLHFHPEMTVEDAYRLVTLRTTVGVVVGLTAAYTAAMGENQPDPPQAAPAS